MVLGAKPLVVRTVAEEDRYRLANLIHFETLVHRHLDWRPAIEWIGYSPYLVAERGPDLLAALACPPDPPNVSWIHLFAVTSDLTAARAWEALWPPACTWLLENTQADTVAAIPLQRWFRSLLDSNHFTFTHNVLVLSWTPGGIPSEEKRSSVRVRPMHPEDLPAVEQVDLAAFVPVWRNSYDGLELAYRQSAVATVAELDGQLVGYQISTATAMGGHLARLAVHPSLQGQGIGYELVRDLQIQFKRRGAHSVTVNTQQNNQTSLSLYRKAGFRPTGEDYPVYQFVLVR